VCYGFFFGGKPMEHAADYALIELEQLAKKEFKSFGVDSFDDLPEKTQSQMLHTQETIFRKYGVSKEDYTYEPDFIGAD
jgi:hypothetical protein